MQLADWARRHNLTAPALTELLTMLAPNVPAPVGMMTNEAAVQRAVRLATNQTGGLLLRNNSGAMQDATGRWVRFGLGNDSKPLNAKFKSSDLIGITPRTIELQHVGQVWGIFTGMEIKRPGWSFTNTPREAAQLFFHNTIRARGGFAAFATSPEDYLHAIGGAPC